MECSSTFTHCSLYGWYREFLSVFFHIKFYNIIYSCIFYVLLHCLEGSA